MSTPKYGVDDFLLKFGPDEFRKVIEAAKKPTRPPKPKTMKEIIAASPMTEAPADQPFYNLTDTGNAERFMFQHRQEVRYVWYGEEFGKWITWDGTRWIKGYLPMVHSKAIQTIRSINSEAARDPDVTRKTAISRHAIASESTGSISSMLKSASTMPGMAESLETLDRHPFLLNVANGTIDLETGKFGPHCREHLITKIAPTHFDPAAKCPLWMKFLKLALVDDDLIDFMQRLLGYCLTGDVGEHVLPIFLGGGSNGKSTIINMMQDLLGQGYAAKAPNSLLVMKRTEQHPTEITVLDGARFAYASETENSDKLSEALIKDLTGGELITARQMKKDYYSFVPTHKLILSTNHQPRVRGNDDGIWRRLKLVPFNTKFWDPSKPNESGPDELRKDPDFGKKLKLELPGILNWLIEGARIWRREGLSTPKLVNDETDNYRQSEDTFGQFMTECVSVSNANQNITLKEFCEHYKKWSDSEGSFPMSNRNVAAELRRRGVRVDKGTENKTYCFNVRVKQLVQRSSDIQDYGD